MTNTSQTATEGKTGIIWLTLLNHSPSKDSKEVNIGVQTACHTTIMVKSKENKFNLICLVSDSFRYSYTALVPLSRE